MKFRTLCLLSLFLTQICLATPGFEALLDFRPSWAPQSETIRAENELDLFYRVSDDFYFGYVQEFQLPLYASENAQSVSLKDGYLKTDQNLTDRLRVESRWILPTNEEEQNKGLNGGVRPIISYRLLGDASRGVEFSESIVARWYRQSAGAIPFENRMELTALYAVWGDKLTLKLPVIWQWQRTEATGTQILWVNPEVIYHWSDNFRLGMAYYSENILKVTRFDLIAALTQGTMQIVMQLGF